MREMSIRAALGASRTRAFRQMLTESLLLALAGGFLGLLLGWSGTRALIRFFPERMPIPRLEYTRVDWEVLAFTFGLSIITGIVFGLMPAFQASRADIGEALKTGTRGAGAGRGLRALRNGLILVETALSVILLVGGGLMFRSFSRLMTSDLGFHPERVLTLRVPVPSNIKEKPQQIAYYTRLLAEVQAVPGLNSAGIIGPLPLAGVDANGTFGVRGRHPATGETPLVKLRTASPGYFRAMGLKLMGGRVFDESDSGTAPRVVVISDSLARRYFPGENPIGRHVGASSRGDGPWSTVVGVVGDVKHMGLTDDGVPELYHPYQQFIFSPFMTTIVVRTAAPDPADIAATVQRQIRAMNPDQPINDVLTMTEVVSRSAAQPRLYTLLLGIFAAVALVLAAAGLYGVLSYAVSQRVREIGIRVALGASARSIMRHVVGSAMLIVLTGILAGLAGAYALSRLLATQLYQVKPTDPVTYAVVCILVGCVAAAAAWLPARRATRVDPNIALRCD
jgi:putative ABC transport system permease protein